MGVNKVRIDIHWTVFCVFHGTEERDRQWNLRFNEGTHGRPLDCPMSPSWYEGTELTVGSKVYPRYTWTSIGLSYESFMVRRD